MTPKKKIIRFLIIFLFLIIYFLIAARPVPREMVLTPKWISSLESDSPEYIGKISGSNNPAVASGELLPFALGSRFGYIGASGQFAVNRNKTNDVYLGAKMWSEYNNAPSSVEIKNTALETIVNIENVNGYPVLLDNRIFIFGRDQNELSEIDPAGDVMWTYQYGAPVTCIDAAAGLVLTGSLDGVIEILDTSGRRMFYFTPGGSRYEVILGCAIAPNGSRVAVICGIDAQRFMLLERLGNTGSEYRVVHHEYLKTGFRRPVHILFVDEDRRVVYEREDGIGLYDIKSRRGIVIPLDDKITAIDGSGDQGMLFLITSRAPRRNELIGIKIPEGKVFSGFADARDLIFFRAPFISDDVFLGRIPAAGSRINGSAVESPRSTLVVGGGNVLISFDMERK